MKLKYNNWNQVSIAKYHEIVDIIEDNECTDLERTIGLLAVLADVDTQTIYNMRPADVNIMAADLKWLGEFSYNKNFSASSIKINNKKYNIVVNLHNFSIAQYVDFQLYWGKQGATGKYMSQVLSCFIIPDGYNYNDGYDVVELQNEIDNNLPITTANAIMFFFLRELVSSIRALRIYSKYLVKKSSVSQEVKDKMNQKIEETMRILMDGLASSMK